MESEENIVCHYFEFHVFVIILNYINCLGFVSYVRKSLIVEGSFLRMCIESFKKLIGYNKHKVWKYFLPMKQLRVIERSRKLRAKK